MADAGSSAVTIHIKKYDDEDGNGVRIVRYHQMLVFGRGNARRPTIVAPPGRRLLRSTHARAHNNERGMFWWRRGLWTRPRGKEDRFGEHSGEPPCYDRAQRPLSSWLTLQNLYLVLMLLTRVGICVGLGGMGMIRIAHFAEREEPPRCDRTQKRILEKAEEQERRWAHPVLQT
ncbi:10832_t:CDS:2 [Acaulospora colombiana]|uniref:10832_t:CDS:1 n=1 Tax=Acaulospora colombiana TaxID=27376 RepID=A0ACA9MDR0_9GLOM|nr:10832_t:CDS:2 [Acaulospora colombiana]